MAATIGAGEYRYEYQPDWANLPSGMSLQGPSGVAVDSSDQVYVFQRQGPAVLIFNRSGQIQGVWQRRDGVPADAHHIHVGPDDTVYLTDRDAPTKCCCTIPKVGCSGRWGRETRQRCRRPSTTRRTSAWRRRGELYVADGYGNSSVHRFSAAGDYLSSFGSPGSGPGQFRVPHSVRVSSDGRVYVADRENHRVQVFTAEGQFVTEWTDFKCPMGVHIDAAQVVYVTDQIPRISLYTLDGELLARGRTFEGAHQVYTDSEGSIYGIDTANQRVQKFAKL